MNSTPFFLSRPPHFPAAVATRSQVARRAGLPPDRVCAEVLPGDKASKIEELQVKFAAKEPLVNF